MTPRRVRVQDVRRYAVQIRAAGSNDTQATGVIVSTRGDIVTCHHVVEELAGSPPQPDQVVADVVLPPDSGGEREFSCTFVAGTAEADLAVIRIRDMPENGLPAGSVASIGAAGDCSFHPFVSYGFRTLDNQVGGYAKGDIFGPVMDAGVPELSHPPLQLESAQISPGMSGSPVLDMERNLVVGLITNTWFPDESTKDRDTAWATDLANLEVLQTDIELATGALPKGAIGEGPDLPVDPALAVADRPGVFLQTAPPPVAHLRGRKAILRQLDEDHSDPTTAISSLVGLGGQGKSAILRAWVDQQLNRSPSPNAVYWWSFDSNPEVGEFLQHALLHFLDAEKLSKSDQRELLKVDLRAASLARAVRARPAILILDGIEAVFDPGEPGRLASDLRTLVRMLASYGETVHCVITSRLPVLDLIDVDSDRAHTVGPLRKGDAVQLLRDFGAHGDDENLRSLADRLDRHALSLVLVGALISKKHGGDPSGFTSLDDLGPDNDDLHLRFQRILDDYDRLLSEEQQVLLELLALQRVPIPEEILDRITQSGKRRDHPLSSLTSLSRRQYSTLLDSLIEMGVVMRDFEARTLSCQALVKKHFAEKVNDLPVNRQRELHWAIAKAYLRSVDKSTFGALGLSASLFAGTIALRQPKPQALVIAGRALIEDKMLGEARHFIARMRGSRSPGGAQE
jgi:S1-C subfamily serine protease